MLIDQNQIDKKGCDICKSKCVQLDPLPKDGLDWNKW